jgi:hypothetical protein
MIQKFTRLQHSSLLFIPRVRGHPPTHTFFHLFPSTPIFLMLYDIRKWIHQILISDRRNTWTWTVHWIFFFFLTSVQHCNSVLVAYYKDKYNIFKLETFMLYQNIRTVIIPWNSILLEKLVKKLLPFYGTLRFITVFRSGVQKSSI